MCLRGGVQSFFPMAGGQIQIGQEAQCPVCSHESTGSLQHPIYRQTLCPNSIHISHVGSVEWSIHMYLFFLLLFDKAKRCAASVTLCHSDFKWKRTPRRVQMCIQSGAVRGDGSLREAFHSARLHNPECLSIDPQAEEELSGAENKRQHKTKHVGPPLVRTMSMRGVFLQSSVSAAVSQIS